MSGRKGIGVKADDLLDKIEFMRDRSHVRYYRESLWEKVLLSAGFKIEFRERVGLPAALATNGTLVNEDVSDGVSITISESLGMFRSIHS